MYIAWVDETLLRLSIWETFLFNTLRSIIQSLALFHWTTHNLLQISKLFVTLLFLYIWLQWLWMQPFLERIFPHQTIFVVKSEGEKYVYSLQRRPKDGYPPDWTRICCTCDEHKDPTKTYDRWHLKYIKEKWQRETKVVYRMILTTGVLSIYEVYCYKKQGCSDVKKNETNQRSFGLNIVVLIKFFLAFANFPFPF